MPHMIRVVYHLFSYLLNSAVVRPLTDVKAGFILPKLTYGNQDKETDVRFDLREAAL